MTREVDTVNMAYHHGHVRDGLIAAGLDLARSGGPDAVGLRAATRGVGVSHNAAYRHFADRDSLLRAVCERCMRELALLMEARVAAVAETGDPVAHAWACLSATGRSYVEFACTETGWFRTAFAVPSSHGAIKDGEGGGASGRNPYELLSARLDDLVRVGALPAERRPGAEFAAWSAVHGLSTLLIDGPLTDLPPPERETALEKVLAVVAQGL